MRIKKLLLPVVAGLIVGQLFAEGERPFSVANTVRFGYNDNPDRVKNGEGSSFVTDIVDLAFRAAFSERTELTVKSQLTLFDDNGGTEIYPNLYAMLSHSISPQLLLRLSEYYRSGEKSGNGAGGSGKRYNYYENVLTGSADYILDEKNLLKPAVSHSILRNENDKKLYSNDYTTVSAEMAWKHDIAPQRTYSELKIKESQTTYDNRDSSSDKTDLTAGFGHTFNQQWQGNVEMGVTYVRPDQQGAQNESSPKPFISAGLTYSPSPDTRLSVDFASRYEESGNNQSSGQTSHELRFGAQHQLTAKLMAKATARFARVSLDENATAAGTGSSDEDQIDLALRLTYQLNRMNFLEAGVRHSSVDRDTGDSWDQNVVDIGWRIELN